MTYRPITAEDLAKMTEPQQVHAIISQLAVACAVLANVLRDSRRRPEPYEPHEFMLQFADRRTLPEAYDAVNKVADQLADVQVAIEAAEKEAGK